MIHQERVHTPTGPRTRVTFQLPRGTWAESVHLVGDFNDWDASSHPFHQDRDGAWWLAVDLDGPGPFHFRYLVDGECWLTDGQAEGGLEDGALAAFVVRPELPAAPPRSSAARELRTRRAGRTMRRLTVPATATMPAAPASTA
jgi:hypothetical protein